MLLNTPFKLPERFLIPVLDAISDHKLPHTVNVPALYKQKIEVTEDMYPERPKSRSQLYLRLNPMIQKPWIGGFPIGKIVEEKENQAYKFIAKKYNVDIYKLEYNPPIHLTFKWSEYGGEEQAHAEALAAQKKFTELYKASRNQYRVSYCELTDAFFLQVRINHIFPNILFECDIDDARAIFEHDWYLVQNEFKNKFDDVKYRYRLVQKDEKMKKGKSITKFLFPADKFREYEDNNVFNCRKYNLVGPK
ncbi:unnamed protein product [Blepharisma stoltei]|uniref:Uncharacterized protein n=1 Tax=Blepharisma stoltei TaxID=1481888 RepID=A0AAU9K5N6_9CILI|nr:unnamed protein product [Blepharisma stoltei]